MIDPIAILSGQPMSKAELEALDWEDQDRLIRAEACYGRAMAAMEAYEALPVCRRCEGEYGHADETCQICGTVMCGHCMSRHEETCGVTG
jgi:hypothetical protein